MINLEKLMPPVKTGSEWLFLGLGTGIVTIVIGFLTNLYKNRKEGSDRKKVIEFLEKKGKKEQKVIEELIKIFSEKHNLGPEGDFNGLLGFSWIEELYQKYDSCFCLKKGYYISQFYKCITSLTDERIKDISIIINNFPKIKDRYLNLDLVKSLKESGEKKTISYSISISTCMELYLVKLKQELKLIEQEALKEKNLEINKEGIEEQEALKEKKTELKEEVPMEKD